LEEKKLVHGFCVAWSPELSGMVREGPEGQVKSRSRSSDLHTLL
jgi:hypothetical protein